LLWLPSQNGGLAVCLQPQKMTSSSRSALKATGVKPVPACEPSQKGCCFDRPQLHQK
jgi:hypothetical protein